MMPHILQLYIDQIEIGSESSAAATVIGNGLRSPVVPFIDNLIDHGRD